MAKSIRAQLKTGTIEISHAGQEKTFFLPSWLTELEKIDQLNEFYGLAEELQLGLFHQGIAQVFVQLRAKARKFKDGKPVLMDYNTIQDEIREFQPPTLAADKVDKNREKAIAALVKLGLSREDAEKQIEKALSA